MTDIRTNYCVACKEMADRIEALETENARLREALEWYVAEDENTSAQHSQETAMSDLIERVARAIADTTDFDGDRMASRYADSELRDMAQAAIAAIEADRAALVAEIVAWLRDQDKSTDVRDAADEIEAKWGGRDD